MSRARVAAAWGCALALLASGGCARDRVIERAPISFWTSRQPEALAGALQAFETANPTLRVALRTLPASELVDSVEAALDAGHAPDLCDVPMDELGPWLERGALSDWSAGVADLRPVLRGWEPCMVGDAIYALPWTLRAPVLLYDRSLLAGAQLDSTEAPATWDQFRTTAARVTRAQRTARGYGIAAGSPAECVSAWLAWAPGAEAMDGAVRPRAGRFSSAANADALAFLQSLVPYALVAAQDSLEREFVRGRLALLIADPSLVAEARAAGRSVGLGTLPRRGGAEEASGPYASGDALVSFTASRHKEDALRLARFLVEPSSLEALAAADPRLLPARVGADTMAAFRGRADAVEALRLVATSRHRPHLRDWDTLEFQLGEAVAEVLAGRETPARALAVADTLAAARRGMR